MKRCGFPSPMGRDCDPGCGLYNEEKDCCGLTLIPDGRRWAEALIEALGMFSENMQRQHLGYSMAYPEEVFEKLLSKE